MSEHVPTLTKFAQFEHDYGSIERGHAILNTLIKSNPKRSDFLFLHFVKIIKEDHIEKARAILKNVISSSVDEESKVFKRKHTTNVPASFKRRRNVCRRT